MRKGFIGYTIQINAKGGLKLNKGICVGFLCEYFTCILHVFWILNINAVFFLKFPPQMQSREHWCFRW